MKITNRDKVLLMVLGVIIVIFAYYKLIFVKQMDKLDKLKKEKAQCEQKLKMLKNNPVEEAKTESQIKIMNSKIKDKSSIFFNNLPQEKLIVTIDDMLKNAKLSNNSMNFSQPSTGKEAASSDTSKNSSSAKSQENPLQKIIDEYIKLSGDKTQVNTNIGTSTQSKAASNNTSNNKNSDNGVERVEVTMDYNGDYSNLINFLKLIETYNRKIIISNVNVTHGKDSGVAGSMVLEFYSVPKLILEDNNNSKWEFQGTYGKDNPFDSGVIYEQSKSSDTLNQSANVQSDFMMEVKPTSSDLPTVTMGKAKDSSRSTYVYADSSNVENVEVSFTQSNGKLYYKYRTSSYSYPENYSAVGNEFTINGDSINFMVYSSKRNSAEDKSGVNIKITNDTNKKVVIKVLEDDSVKPRVNVLAVKGDVQLQK